MANLKNYIAGIVSSISDARVASDVQLASIAEEYKANDILRFFAVPKMKIGDVELDIPVALNEIDEKEVLSVERDKTYNAAKQAIALAYGYRNIPYIDIESYNDVVSNIQEYVDEVLPGRENEVDNEHIDVITYEHMENVWTPYFERYVSEVEGKDFKIDNPSAELGIRKAVVASFYNSLSDNLDYFITAEQLKGVDSHLITNIKIKISEEGLVWSKDENGYTLIPE